GAWVGIGGLRLIQFFGPSDLPRLAEAAVDIRVLGWGLAICVVTGILVGMTPAIVLVRRTLLPSDGGGRGASQGTAASATRRVLVVGELALAIVLLSGAGLLLRSWQKTTD